MNVIDKLLYPADPSGHGHIMDLKTAADFQLRCNIFEIIRMPVRVRIVEYKVKKAFQRFDQIMGISKPGIYVL